MKRPAKVIEAHDTPEKIIGWSWATTGLLVVLFILSLMADIMPSPVFGFLALGVFLTFSYDVARNSPYTFALLAFFIFLRLTMFISGIAIGSGAYMPEVDQFGAASGAFLRLCMIYVFLIGVIRQYIEPRARDIIKRAEAIGQTTAWSDLQHHWWVMAFFGLCGLLYLYLALVGLRDGFALLNGVTRMAYRLQHADDPLFNSILSNRSLVVGFLGLIFAQCTGFRRKMAVSLLLAYLFLNILFGEKFTSLVAMLIGFFVATMVQMAWRYPWRNAKNLAPLLIGAGVVSLVTLPVMLIVYSGDAGLDEGIQKFYERVSSQGQLWYLVDRDVSDAFRFDEPAITQDLKSWLVWDSVQQEYPYAGLYNVMGEYAPNRVLGESIDQGLGFTMAFEAYLVKILGWIGAIPVFLVCALVFAGVLRYLLWSIAVHDPISMFLALKMYLWSTGTFADGDLYFMLGYKLWGLAVIALIYETMTKSPPQDFNLSVGVFARRGRR